VCLPIIGAVLGAASSIAGVASSNAAAMADYKYQIAKRDADWKQTLSVWGHKRNDYYNQIDSNYDAVGRSYASEQTRMNESFMQAAFQKQDMLTQLIKESGVGEVSGRSAAKFNQATLAAYGRNNATIAENLASARNAMIQRNEDARRQLMSANNRAWSEVALKPTETFAPKPPTMQSPLGAILGGIGGIVGSIGSMSGKTPDAGNLDTQKDTPFGNAPNAQAWKDSFNYKPSIPIPIPENHFKPDGTNSYNALTSRIWQN
jgi:hypothetical protein